MTTTEAHVPEFLSVAETAKLLRLSELTVYRSVWSRRLPAIRLADHGVIRIPRAALEEFAHPSERPARAPRTGPEPAVEPQAHGGGDREEKP